MVKRSNLYATMWALYAASILGMNVLAAKQIDIFGFTVTCGVFLSGFVFIAQDVVTEVFGVEKSRRMIFTSYAIVFIVILLFQLAIIVRPSAYWGNQDAFSIILKTTARITVASFLAYGMGSLANTGIMGKLKEKYPKHLLVRAVTSTIFGQVLDNGVFSFVAFLGVLPVRAIISMTVAATIIEVITEIVLFPAVKLVVNSAVKEEE